MYTCMYIYVYIYMYIYIHKCVRVYTFLEHYWFHPESINVLSPLSKRLDSYREEESGREGTQDECASVSTGWKTHKCQYDEEAIEEILHIKVNFQQKQVCQKRKRVKNIFVQEITVEKNYMQIENTYVQVKHLCQSDEETLAFVKVIRRLCFIEYRSAKQDIILQVSFHESVLQISNNWSVFCQSDDRLCHMHY